MCGILFSLGDFRLPVSVGIFQAIGKDRRGQYQRDGIVRIKLQYLFSNAQHPWRIVFILVFVHGLGIKIGLQFACGILRREFVRCFFHRRAAGERIGSVVVVEFLVGLGLGHTLAGGLRLFAVVAGGLLQSRAETA